MLKAIYVSTDDMRPSMIPLWEEYWDKLKIHHPSLKVTCFVPVFYQEFNIFPEEDVVTSNSFKEWYEERKNWVEINLHGYTHSKPFENRMSYKKQENIIANTLSTMKNFINTSLVGYKAPFYMMDSNTLKALINLDIKWYDQWWQIYPLAYTKRTLLPYISLGTHTGDYQQNNPDNINKIYDILNTHLYKLEEHNYEYTTATEIIKNATE